MAKPKGSCLRCGRMTSRLCCVCGDAFFCSNMCEEFSTEEHAKTCGTHEKTTADDLIRAVACDLLPGSYQTRKDFGFDRCNSFMDQSHLLGVYKMLVIHCNGAPPLLNKWRQEGKMEAMIREEFEENRRMIPDAYYNFFKARPELFNIRAETQSTAWGSTPTGRDGQQVAGDPGANSSSAVCNIM